MFYDLIILHTTLFLLFFGPKLHSSHSSIEDREKISMMFYDLISRMKNYCYYVQKLIGVWKRDE